MKWPDSLLLLLNPTRQRGQMNPSSVLVDILAMSDDACEGVWGEGEGVGGDV